MNDIEAVKSRVNIVEIVSEKVRLKRSGSNYFGLCPFHSEKTPSFSVSETMQRFKCFGCSESGDVITFIMKTENLEFPEALEQLAEKVGYKLSKKLNVKNQKEDEIVEKLLKVNKFVSDFFQQVLLNGENEGIKYARKRGLDEKLIRKFGIGYASDSHQKLTTLLEQKGVSLSNLVKFGFSVERDGKVIDKFRNRLVFTIYNERGNVVGFSGRYFGKEDPNFKPPKYLNSPETPVFKKSFLLFGLYQAQESIRKLNFVIITEGQMNVISSHRAGVENIVAPLGTSFTDQHLKLLSRYTSNIYFAFDRDTAGKKALFRSLEMAFKQDLNVKVISWDSKIGKDPDELISFNPKLWVEGINSALDPIEFIFSEFAGKYDLNNLDHVNNFLKFILPLISSHKNEVKKEFYYKYLSEKLNISVTSIKDMVNQNKQIVYERVDKKVNDDKEFKKIEINVFDKIFALILQNWASVKHLILALERDYLPEKYRELYDCLTLFTDIENVLEVGENIDQELKGTFEDLMLLNILLDDHISTEEHIAKLIPVSRNEFKKMLVMEWKKDPENEKLFKKISTILNQKL